MDNIFIKLMDFPSTKIKSCVSKNDDGTYTIFVNARLNEQQQLRAVMHEKRHLENNDFERNVSIDSMEVENV